MKRRRRWFQYSLRSFLVVVTALAVWLGVVVNRAREQREAVKAIEALGGSVMYDWHFFETPEQKSVMEHATVQLRTWLRRIDCRRACLGPKLAAGRYSSGPGCFARNARRDLPQCCGK